jgi:glycosyltransferase involved in cell wall biosynthesis
MHVAISLCGSDLGRSGVGVYVREVLPRLRAELAARGGRLTCIGHADDLGAYDAEIGDAARHLLPSRWRRPGWCAAWHLVRASPCAAQLGADVLLLPAANRRTAITGGVPTVAVVHDLAQLHVRGKYDRRRMFYAREVVPRSLARATRLVAVSRATGSDLAQALPSRRRDVRVVTNGVDAARFRPRSSHDPELVAARIEVGLDGPYLLYVARLEHPGKNHLRLLRGFAASQARRDHVLALAGADWGAAPLVRAEIDRLGLAQRVHLLGFVRDELMPPLIGGAAAILMLGLHEGFGLPALEALAAGRPVLASTTGALPEVVGDLGVLCDPHDEAAIAAGLDDVIARRSVRQRAAALGPPHAARHGWERTSGGLLDACVEACGHGVRS